MRTRNREPDGEAFRPPPADGQEQPVLDSAALFARNSEVFIRHAGEMYRLRLTRNGKLILNK